MKRKNTFTLIEKYYISYCLILRKIHFDRLSLSVTVSIWFFGTLISPYEIGLIYGVLAISIRIPFYIFYDDIE